MAQRIVEYKILCDDTRQDLSDAVNESIKVGWQPQGGVSVLLARPDSINMYDVFYYQSIVRMADL